MYKITVYMITNITYLISILCDIATKHSFEEFAYERIERKCDLHGDYVRKFPTYDVFWLESNQLPINETLSPSKNNETLKKRALQCDLYAAYTFFNFHTFNININIYCLDNTYPKKFQVIKLLLHLCSRFLRS